MSKYDYKKEDFLIAMREVYRNEGRLTKLVYEEHRVNKDKDIPAVETICNRFKWGELKREILSEFGKNTNLSHYTNGQLIDAVEIVLKALGRKTVGGHHYEAYRHDNPKLNLPAYSTISMRIGWHQAIAKARRAIKREKENKAKDKNKISKKDKEKNKDRCNKCVWTKFGKFCIFKNCVKKNGWRDERNGENG